MAETTSQRHERELAEVVPGGRQVLASGAKLDRHDVRTEQSGTTWLFRYEAKCTQRKSYSFKAAEWKDLVEYATLRGERPAWAVRFYGEGEVSSSLPVKADLVVVELNDWCEVLAELERLRGGQAE